MIFLPHCIMGGTGKINENLLTRSEISKQLPYVLWINLLIMYTADHQRGELTLRDDRLVPAPCRGLRCPTNPRSPRGAHGIGFNHVCPDALGNTFIVLSTASNLSVPVCNKFI